MPLVLALLGALRAALRTRTDLTLENLALRQQLALLRRRSKRPQFGRLDRLLWVWLSSHWAGWRKGAPARSPRERDSLAPAGLPRLLGLEVPPRANGSTADRLGACGSRAHHGARESALGRATHSRRVAQTRARRLAAHRPDQRGWRSLLRDSRAYGLRRALALSKFTSGISRSDARDGPRGFLPVAFFIALPCVGRDASRADDSYRVFGLLDEDNVPAQEDMRSAAIWSALGQHMSSRHRVRASWDGRKQWKLLDPSPSL